MAGPVTWRNVTAAALGSADRSELLAENSFDRAQQNFQNIFDIQQKQTQKKLDNVNATALGNFEQFVSGINSSENLSKAQESGVLDKLLGQLSPEDRFKASKNLLTLNNDLKTREFDNNLKLQNFKRLTDLDAQRKQDAITEREDRQAALKQRQANFEKTFGLSEQQFNYRKEHDEDVAILRLQLAELRGKTKGGGKSKDQTKTADELYKDILSNYQLYKTAQIGKVNNTLVQSKIDPNKITDETYVNSLTPEQLNVLRTATDTFSEQMSPETYRGKLTTYALEHPSANANSMIANFEKGKSALENQTEQFKAQLTGLKKSIEGDEGNIYIEGAVSQDFLIKALNENIKARGTEATGLLSHIPDIFSPILGSKSSNILSNPDMDFLNQLAKNKGVFTYKNQKVPISQSLLERAIADKKINGGSIQDALTNQLKDINLKKQKELSDLFDKQSAQLQSNFNITGHTRMDQVREILSKMSVASTGAKIEAETEERNKNKVPTNKLTDVLDELTKSAALPKF